MLPVVIGVLTNSWGPLTEESAIRMAFGSVAGQTIAILSAIAAVVVTIAFRAPWASVVAIAVVAAFIIALALGNIGQAAELLQERLDTVAELSIRFG